MASRRVGTETSKTRAELLGAVEELLLEAGHAAVSYRAVAARAGVTSSLVQYYFPTRDTLFVAAIRRRTEQNIERLRRALEQRPGMPLHVIWEYSQRESLAALNMEYLALGNHLESVREEIAQSNEQIRRIQLDAIEAAGHRAEGTGADLPLTVVAFLATGIPRLIQLEQRVGATLSHAEVADSFLRYLDRIEPPEV